MKVRLSRAGLRLRLTGADVSSLGLGHTVTERTPFPNGVFECSLTAVPEGIAARLTERGIVVTIPTASLADLEAGGAVKADLQTPGEAIHLLVEKDRRPDP